MANFWYAMKSQLTKAKIHELPGVWVHHLAWGGALNQSTIIEFECEPKFSVGFLFYFCKDWPFCFLIGYKSLNFNSVEVPDVAFQGSKDKTQVFSTKGCNILGTFQCQTRYTNAREVVLEKNQRHSKIPLYRLDQLSFSMQWMILNLPLSLQSKECQSLSRVSPGATLWPPWSFF